MNPKGARSTTCLEYTSDVKKEPKFKAGFRVSLKTQKYYSKNTSVCNWSEEVFVVKQVYIIR